MYILCLETDEVKRYVGAPIGTGIMVPFTGLFSGWIGHGRIVCAVLSRRLDDTGENARHAVGRCRKVDSKMGSGSVSAAALRRVKYFPLLEITSFSDSVR